MENILRVLEPLQMGAGTPDGTVLLVQLLRQWVKAAEAPDMDQQTTTLEAATLDALQVIFSTDLKNAYGNAYRSVMLRAVTDKVPRLAPFLGAKWSTASNRVWPRLRTVDGRLT